MTVWTNFFYLELQSPETHAKTLSLFFTWVWHMNTHFKVWLLHTILIYEEYVWLKFNTIARVWNYRWQKFTVYAINLSNRVLVDVSDVSLFYLTGPKICDRFSNNPCVQPFGRLMHREKDIIRSSEQNSWSLLSESIWISNPATYYCCFMYRFCIC